MTQVAADLIIAAALTRELLKAMSTVIKKRRKYEPSGWICVDVGLANIPSYLESMTH